MQRLRPDAVLMDIRMPVMDGNERMQQIRQQAWGQELGLMAISASAFEYNCQESLAAGADDFLGKPLRLAHLLE